MKKFADSRFCQQSAKSQNSECAEKPPFSPQRLGKKQLSPAVMFHHHMVLCCDFLIPGIPSLLASGILDSDSFLWCHLHLYLPTYIFDFIDLRAN
jgi:hypothetical protein